MGHTRRLGMGDGGMVGRGFGCWLRFAADLHAPQYDCSLNHVMRLVVDPLVCGGFVDILSQGVVVRSVRLGHERL
jgi:hypothetical protein